MSLYNQELLSEYNLFIDLNQGLTKEEGILKFIQENVPISIDIEALRNNNLRLHYY
jgi:hypothetical protein